MYTCTLEHTLKIQVWGTWVGQLVQGPTSDLMVYEFEPHVGLYADSSDPGAYF